MKILKLYTECKTTTFNMLKEKKKREQRNYPKRPRKFEKEPNNISGNGKNIITIKNDRQVKYIRDSKKTQLVNWTMDVRKLSSVQHRDNEIEKYETEIMRYKEQSEMVKLKV